MATTEATPTLSSSEATDFVRVGELVYFAAGTFDAEGNLYQSNFPIDRISRISPEGGVTTFAEGPDED